MQTIGDRLDRRKGFAPGFDFLRVVLAICVVAWHQYYVVAGNMPGSMNIDLMPVVWFPGYGILVMFFALSGFLIVAGGLRLSLKNFLINRGLRIMPALIVLGLPRRPAVIVAGAVALVGIGLAMHVAGFAAPIQAVPTAVAVTSPLQKLLGTALFLGRGSRLLVAFLLGIATYLCRHRIPYDPRILIACVAVCALAAVLGPTSWMTMPVLNAIACPALVYIAAAVLLRGEGEAGHRVRRIGFSTRILRRLRALEDIRHLTAERPAQPRQGTLAEANVSRSRCG